MKRKTLFLITIFFLFVTAFGLCLPQYFTEYEDRGSYSVNHFDWWSDNMMIDDLMYHRHYDGHYLFTMNISWSRLVDEDKFADAEWIPYDAYTQDKIFDRELWEEYTGNIVIQRFFYELIDKLLPFSGKSVLLILRSINVILSALVLTGIIYWISCKNGGISGVIIAIVIAIFVQCYAMFVQNLYWVPWTLLLPMMSIMLYFESPKLQESKMNIVALFIIAFITCTIKELCYFELITSTMIAMALPLLYKALEKKYKIKRFLQEFSAVLIGAITSFILTFGIKIMMFCHRYGWELGIKYVFEHAKTRLVDGTEAVPGGIAGIKRAVQSLLYQPAVSVRGIVRINWGQMVLICLFCIVVLSVCGAFKWIELSEKLRITILITMVSAFAPLSWAVMAAPHACIHSSHCSVVWICGFYFFAMILIIQTVGAAISKLQAVFVNVMKKKS